MATFTSTSYGVVLYNPTIQNPATIVSGATITSVSTDYNGDAVHGNGLAAWSVYNYGTIEGTQVGSSGIGLAAGGDVHNGSTAYTATRIAGAAYGIAIFGSAGTVANYGTIEATNGTGLGVFLAAGGTVINGIGASGALISGFHGVDVQGSAGTVFNDGTIAGVGVNSYGVRLYAGGDLINASAGLITGYHGVAIGGIGGTLTNYGTIVGTNRGAATLSGGAVLNGYLGGSGVLMTGYFGIFGNAGISVTNYGTISGTGGGGPFGSGVYLGDGSSVTNGAATQVALISGYDGVRIAGVGTVTNYGTIAGGSNGVGMSAGGLVTNIAGGVITGYIAVNIFGGAGAVVNYGLIQRSGSNGAAVFLQSGGGVINGAAGTISGPLYGNAVRIDTSSGALTNLGIIQGAAAGDDTVYFGAGGTITNSGLISGANDVVLIRVDGLVTNTGTIAATGEAAVWLADGGTVVNNGLLIATNDVVFTGFTAGTIVNYGTIIDTGIYGDGVCLEAGGIVSNSGAIVGATIGVEAETDIATVANLGTISATQSSSTGIWLQQGGIVVNGDGGTPSALIEGGADGVVTGYGGVGAGTVTNYGTIVGPNAGVWLAAGGSLVNFGTVESLGASGDGVSASYAAGVVVNGVTGLIDADNLGVWLQAGGVVANSGVIRGGNNGLDVQGAAGTLVSDGTVEGTGGSGVVLGAGGLVRNNIGGVIEGDDAGVHVFNASGTLINYSTITVTGGYSPAIYLHSGGSVYNHATGLIDGTADGVDIFGAAGTVTNLGTMNGGSRGVLLAAGGTVANGTSGAGGAAIVGGNYGVALIYVGGAITNGTAALTDAAIRGGRGIFSRDGAAAVTNYGTIEGTAQGAVYLNAGGEVTNGAAGSTAARIEGAHGVVIDGAAGTVVNFGTIEAIYVTGVGVFLGQGGAVTNGGSATTDALISGARRGIFVYDALAAVDNFGTIAASITYVSAVELLAGGIVTNRQGGLIDGGGQGVSISGGAGTVTNAGAIVGTFGAGVRLDAGGTIVNGLTTDASITGAYGVVLANVGGIVFNGSSGSTAAVIDGNTYGIFAVDGASTVANYGTITGTVGAGVRLAGGGFVLNTYDAVIASANTGVQIVNAAGALVNAGTVQGGNLGVYLLAGGSVVNHLAGGIAGGDGIRIDGGIGTITNYGAVGGTATYSGFAVQLVQGGIIVNGAATAASASILGTLRGISVYNAAGTVTNFGTIAASISYAAAVYLHAGGSLTNHHGGLIRGGGDGVDIAGAAGIVTNFGSIDGLTDTGVVLLSGGLIVNGPGGATLATISGGFAGVELQNVPATIVNYGTIVDPGFAGAVAHAGASISNHRLVTGDQYGARVSGGPGTVVNSGEVSATGTGGTGISLAAGGVIANSGTIAGGRNGVFFGAATSIGNQGLISGAGLAGVYGGAGVGVITNFGTIAGGVYGVRLVGDSTLFNAGTVAGGSRSVYFLGGNNRVAIDPSAVFIGTVDAYLGAGDVLELAPGSGTLSGFGTSFFGFEAITVDALADWQVAGALTFGAGFVVTDAGALDFDNSLNNDGTLEIETGAVLSFTGTVGGAGTIDFNGPNGTLVFGVPSVVTNSIIDFAPTNAIIFVGIGLAASYSYSGGVLRLNNSGGTQIAQVSLTTPVTNPHFTLSSDLGGSGTLLTVNAQTGTFTGAYFNGVVLNDPTVQNPALVTSTAFITNNYGSYGGDAVYGTSAAAWNLTNQGTITTNPPATGAAGVRFQAGGTVSNSAIISGGINGIVIDGGGGLIANGGIIAATATGAGAGIALLGGGNVSNAAGATISGYNNGVFISGGIGGVANAGTIHSSATAGGPAVYLTQGGGVTNLAGGLIAAYRSAISITGGAGVIANYGTIQHAGTQSAATYLGGGGAVTNAAGGLIFSPHRNAIVISGSAGTVTNSGTILSTATFAQVGTAQTGRYGAVVLNAGGVVSNAANALIAGHTGVDFNNLVGTVFNAGTISQNDPIRYGSGVLLYGGGLVINGPNSTALITAYTSAVQVGPSSQGLGGGGPGTVVNYGTIAHIGSGTSGSAIYLGSGGIVVNYGLISGARGGTSSSSGYPGAVQVRNQTAAVINLGTITNPNNSNGVNLLHGGVLINGANGFNGALIDAPHGGVYIGGTFGMPTLGAVGTVINYGTIRNTTSLGSAVAMAAGGTAINYGLISSARTGVSFTDTAGTINNFGTIVSTALLSGTRGAGVYLGAGGSITNQAGGLITAERAAVSLAFFGSTSAGAVITNFGVLSGATGISIGAGDTGDNTIINYGTITGTNGIAILLGSGDDEIVIASTSQLVGAVSNFQIGDTFDLPFLVFSSAETVSLDAGNVLNISQSGALVYSIQLDPSQSFGTNEFGLANDGSGGTLVVLGPDSTTPVTLTRVLAVNANSGPTPIGIAAPTDPIDPSDVLTVNVTGLPTDGTVVLSDGVTSLSIGQVLTVAQLTGLQFIATPNVDGQSSTFTYSVSDPAGNTGFGTAFLGINLPPPPNSPALINGLGGVEGFGENALPPNDDGSSSAIDITAVFGGGLNFFGQTFTSLYLNNNGNITFTGPLGAFTPEEITAGFGNPIIAAFWADVDTRGGPGVPTGGNATGSNTVYWDLDTVNGVFTATWNDVGYYSGHNDKLDAFQLRLIDHGGGDFDIEFRYQAIYWTTGDASGGSSGLGGVPARAGFSAGDGVNFYELPQSGNQDAMLEIESSPAPLGTQGGTSEIGVYVFEVRGGIVPPPAPTGLLLSPASDSGKPGDNRTNDTTPMITGAGGISGDTITLFADGTAVGTGTVSEDGTWSVTAGLLPDGGYNLTAKQTSGDAVSQASAPLFVRIDTSAPVTVPVSRTVQPNTPATVIGIALPTDPDDDFSDPNQAPTIVVAALPSNGTVSLGGVTPVSLGQQLSTSQLTGLDFTPTGQLGTTDSFTYTVTDLAGNTSSGIATFTIATPPPPPPPPPPPSAVQLFGFLFTYNDGKDYYLGTVADAGHQIGQTINTVAGHYEIISIESALTTQPSGTVSVSIYSHGGVGQASPTPILTGQGLPDGTNGLGSETDAILGLDGDLHPFSGAVEASFQTIPLWSFIYSYADGRAFYTGTVASQTPLTSRTATDSAGNVIGSYSVFQQGVTTRTDGTVVVDRFTLSGVSFIPLRTGVSSINGQGGLGTEQGLITVNSATFAFSSGIEPAVTISQPTLPSTTPPSPNDVAAAQITSLYRDILGRNPDAAGLALYTNALANGTSVATIRTLFAQSSEAQSALNQLYRQIFGRDIDTIGANIYTNALINGSSLASVQLILAQSPEGQAAIQRIYQEVLNRPADGAGLTGNMALIGNPTAPISLSDVRNTVAHSPEAAAKLSQLVVDVLGRTTFAAELVGMENEISTDGVTQQTLQSELVTTNTAGTYSRVFDAAGSTLLSPQSGIPTLFVFTDVSLASDGIVGFDLIRDTIQLPTTIAADFQTVQSRMQSNSTINGTLIHFNSSQEIAIAGVTPGSLTAANFRFV